MEDFTWDTLKDFYNLFLVPLAKWTVGEGLPRFFDITARFNNETEWDSLNKSLEGFYKSLENIAEVTFDACLDFYDYFLEPLASWTVGKGFPQVIDILTRFNTDVDWEAINKALERFWKAIEPFAEAIGQGIIDFFSDIMKLGANVINVIVPGGINALASALNHIDPDIVKAIAYALSAMALSISSIKVGKLVLTRLATLAKTLGNLSKMSVIAIKITLAIAAIKFLHDKSEALWDGKDKEEVQSYFQKYIEKVLGDTKLTASISYLLTGISYVFSGEATPSELVEAFKMWAIDCWKNFSDEVMKQMKKHKLVAKFVASTYIVTLS